MKIREFNLLQLGDKMSTQLNIQVKMKDGLIFKTLVIIDL